MGLLLLVCVYACADGTRRPPCRQRSAGPSALAKISLSPCFPPGALGRAAAAGKVFTEGRGPRRGVLASVGQTGRAHTPPGLSARACLPPSDRSDACTRAC